MTRYRKLIPKPSVSANRRWLNMLTDSARRERVPLTQTEQDLAVRRTRIRKPSDPTRILEKHVLKAVLQFLRAHPAIASVERSQSGVFQEGNRTVRVGFVGKLDVTFMTKTGRYGEVEVKRPGMKPSVAQTARIEKIRSNGGISGYVTSVDEMQALLAACVEELQTLIEGA